MIDCHNPCFYDEEKEAQVKQSERLKIFTHYFGDLIIND